jgi:predicted DsbA family dithiol-disulfide isomerase
MATKMTRMQTERRLRVDVWADISCPWCYIGEARLEHAIANSPHADAIDLVFHSFELDPHLSDAPRSTPEFVAEKLGVTVDQAIQMERRMANMAHAEGLPYEAVRPLANSFDAHRVIQLAAEKGLALALFRALQRALFSGQPDTFSHERITVVAAGVGLDTAQVRAVLSGDDYAEVVRRDEKEAARLGATGVPFAVFDGRLALPGAASPAVYASVIERAWGQDWRQE